MKAPRPWREQPPKSPAQAQVVTMLSAAAEPSVPAGAKARVRGRLTVAPAQPSRGVWVGVTLAGALALGGLFAASGPAHPDAAPPERKLAQDKAWTTSPAFGQRLALGALGSIALSPSSELSRASAPDAPYVLRAGALEVQTLQAGLRIVAGRYEIQPGPNSVHRVRLQPFEHVVEEGWAQVHGPEGVQRVQASAPQTSRTRPEVSARPKPATAVVRAQKASARVAPSSKPSASTRPGAPANAAPAVAATPSDVSGPGGPRTEADPTPGALYRRARAEPRVSVALGLYDQVMAQGGPWAEMAGHQAVRLCMQDGLRSEALRRLMALERSFPQGAHLPELWLARVDILVAQGRLGRAADDIDRYLQRQPESLRAPEMYYLRAELHREAGRVAAARADYARVRSGPYAVRAQAALKALKVK